ncbi:MAG: DOMON-like domain-containing protein [Cyanobacteria bacterium J06598_3]
MPTATHPFSLKPFTQTPLTDSVNITGTALRDGEKLSIEYLVAGNWESLITGELAPDKNAPGLKNPRPERRDRLWEHTCFESFIAPATTAEHTRESPYWEVNLSPQGHWNVFALSSYRQGLSEEQAIAAIPFTINTAAKGLQLTMNLAINKLIPPTQPIHLGISMIVLLQEGNRQTQETFWAIAHPGPEADFHHPASFVIPL